MRTKSEAKRLQILNAAQQLFLSGGTYAAVSMDDIAKKAPVSKQTLYSYFATKEELFLAVVITIVDAPWRREFTNAHYVQAQTGRELAEQLFQVLKELYSIFKSADYQAALQITIGAARTHPQLAEHYKKQVIDQAFAALQQILRRAQEKELLCVSPNTAARMLVGAMLTYMFMQILSPSENTLPTDDELREIATNLVKN